MTDVPETHHHEPERGRLGTKGRRTDDGGWTTLLAIHGPDDQWLVYGSGPVGLRLTNDVMIALAESILGRAR